MTEAPEVPTLPNSSAVQVALTLFDGAAAAHGLSEKARLLLEVAGAAYQAAVQLEDGRSDRVGRDMLLAAPLPGLDPTQQAIVAGVVALQRAKLRPQRDSAFVGLGAKSQHRALALAAILRLARGLALAPADLLVQVNDDGTTLIIGGAQAEQQVAALDEPAEAWRAAIGPLGARPADDAEQIVMSALAAPDAAEPDERLAALLAHLRPPADDLGGEPIAEAARRTLRRFFDKLLAREEAVQNGEDSEDVHQMRVATRRLRAALQTLEGVFEPGAIRAYRRGLRRIAASLGTVRDGDVFLEHVLAYQAALPADQQDALGPLVAAVSAERAQAREALLAALASKRYRKLKRSFAAFICTPGAGTLPAPEPGITQRLRDFAGSAIWRRYELWRAYDTALPDAADETLHQARIAGKRLRYTLEFFAEALGPRASLVLDPLIALQENLGTLQDIVTAHAHVAALGLADDAGAQAYLAARSAERADLLAALPERWAKVASATYRRRLFELIVKL